MDRASGPAVARRGSCLVLALVMLAACSSTSGPDQAERPGTTTAAAGDNTAGLATAVEEFVAGLYSPGARNLRAVLVSVDGDIVVERYWDSSASTTNNTFSVTKSVISALAGIAVADGSLRGPDQPLRELLPTYAPDMSPAVASITLGQLLTMSAGLPADGPDGPPAWLFSDDWVAGIVSHGTDQAPGEGFAYSSVTSHLIAAAVDDATPGSLLDYAREQLLEPLGIDTHPALQPPMTDDPAVLEAYDRAAFAWPVDPQGHHVGYANIKLTAQDMVKIGQLYLDGGRWDGDQLVPEAWVRDSTRRHVTTGRGDLDGYGYQWWTTTARGHPAFVALGYGGQLVEVVPDLRLVVAASTVVKEDETPFDGTTLVTLVRDVVVPRVE